jgi:DNA-binding NarL/FixJ family response regulator
VGTLPTHDVRVLVVDDALTSRRIMRELLARRGYELAGEAESVAAALLLAAVVRVDAALVDVHLPDGSGFDLATRLKQLQPDMAVLLTSGESDNGFYALAEASGAEGFVPKAQLAQVEFALFWGSDGRE